MEKRLQDLRRALGLTLAAFGAKIGTTAAAVSNWEHGESIPSVRVFQICKVFNVSEKWFNEGTGPMFNAPVSESDAEITRRHILELYEQLPPGLKKEFDAICQAIVDKIKSGDIPPPPNKSVTIGDNNVNINITQ